MSTRDDGRARVVVVTGGASGIGLASAGVLAERGWKVVIADLDLDRCHVAAKPIGAEAVAFDVSDETATESALAEVESRVGPIEALLANAGLIQPPKTPEDFAFSHFDEIVSVNLRGVYVSCVLAGKRMAKRGHGGIVITGSIVASRAMPLHSYAPTKAAVVHMAKCLAADWGRSGVRVNSVSPGFTATPPLLAAIERGQRDEKALTEGSAMGRMVKPEEIGKAVAFLLSDDSSAITGVDLPVDAGWLVGSHLGPYGGVREAR